MRYFKEGDTIWVEPWRAKPFPVIKDLIVDRTALDKIQIAGGFISINAGAAPEANAILVPKKKSEDAFDSAICIGCGACVAACKNASAMLFVSARISQFALLPQGCIEAKERVRAMVAKMDELGFGNCSNTGACEVACPKQIKMTHIARLNREFYKSVFV
jgi:succinate dehydrogenase / fumarate reductase iron-sulfur subunit